MAIPMRASLANATALSTFAIWLEDELCAERNALGVALQDRHQELLNEAILRLKAASMDGRIQLPSCMSMQQAMCDAGNPSLKRVWVPDTSLNVPICRRHHAPPAEPSSPSSSFLIEGEVPKNGHGVLSTFVNAGHDETRDLDESVLRTPGINDVSDENTTKLAMSYESHVPFGQKASELDSSSVDSPAEKCEQRHGTMSYEQPMYRVSLVERRAKSCGMQRLVRIVLSETFEAAFAVLILLNTLTMAFEAQYRGFESGFVLGYDNHVRSADDCWPGAAVVFIILEWFFGVLFTLQLVLKMLCMLHEFFRDIWNIVDVVIVAAWLYSVAVEDMLNIDPMMLRLARLARLLRLLVLVRTIKVFDALYLMTTTIKASMSVLMWSVMLLLLFLVMMGLLLQKVAEPFVRSEDEPLDKRIEVFMFYGTFTRSMLTMFEMTLGNWMPPCRALVENVNEWFMVIFLAHKLVVGFSVVSVINAVFVQETFKVATSDTRIMLMTKERARRTHFAKIRELFQHVDADGSGSLTAAEFCSAFDDPAVRAFVAALDLDIRDAERLFDMIDGDASGTVSLQELSDGISRFRGPAKSFDIQFVLSHFRDMEKVLMHLNHTLTPDMSCSTAAKP